MAVLKFQINQHFTPHIDLKTNLNGVKKVKTLRVNQKSGHIFLQTDKPLYNPKETTVHIRFMATDENLLPANRTYRLQVKVSSNDETKAECSKSSAKSCDLRQSRFPKCENS